MHTKGKISFLLGIVVCLFVIKFSALAEEAPETADPSGPVITEVENLEDETTEEVSEAEEETELTEEEQEEPELLPEEAEADETADEEIAEDSGEEDPAIAEEVAEEEEEPSEEMVLLTISWEELLEKGVLEENEDVILTGNNVMPADRFLFLQGGTVTVEPGATLTVEGLLIVQDGTLLVSEGASLNNEMFVMVSEKGLLENKGTYTQAEEAAFVWEDLKNESDVVGISAVLIDKTVSANDLDELNAALTVSGYRTLTIQVADQELVNELSTNIPDGIVISAK